MEQKKSWWSRLFRSSKQEKMTEKWLHSSKGETIVRPEFEDPGPQVETDVQKSFSHKTPQWEVNKLLLNEYIVEGILGQGGMGTVYLVTRRSFDNQRFAVKTLIASMLEDEERNRLFMRELRTWIELPEHPHVTACCFFRTIEDRLAIFSEYIDGGTLQDWIRDKKILSIESILDIAIQCAWGLQAAHNKGVIHQDMKPANVLMTIDGTAKVTDFGLAHARQVGGLDADAIDRNKSILVSSLGMTEAYCSPEQANWQKLSHRSDMWSWGLSVLEMFSGSVTWSHGTLAKTALEFFADKKSKSPFPAMPKDVYEALLRCFQQDPMDRWDSMDAVAEVFQKIYRDEVGKPYPRKKPESNTNYEGQAIIHDRRVSGVKWDDPFKWLEKALRFAGRDLSELKDVIQEMKGSRKAQALIALEVYDKAKKIYSDLIDQGRKDLEEEFTSLLTNKGLIHISISDLPGAIAIYNQIIGIRDRLVNKEGRAELANDLAVAYMSKAVAMWNSGDNRTAVEIYDKAIEIREELVYQKGQTELTNDLALAYSNKANALRDLGDNREAVETYDKAVEIYERIVYKEGQTELANELALAYLNKANVVRDLGDNRTSVEICNKAIAIYERLTDKEGRSEFANALAAAYMNKANAVRDLGDNRAAMEIYDKAVEIYERIVYKEGQTELANDLAMVLMNKAVAVSALGDNPAAVEIYDKAAAILDTLVYKEGRTELASQLTKIYINKANAVQAIGDSLAAVEIYDKAAEILETMVYKDGHAELANDLALVYTNKAAAFGALGNNDLSVEIYNKAIEIRERLVYKDGRAELANDLATVYMNKAAALTALGDNHDGVKNNGKAIEIWERLIYKAWRPELAHNLAVAYMNKAVALSALGDNFAVVETYDKAIEIREKLIYKEGRTELAEVLAQTYVKKASLHLKLKEYPAFGESVKKATKIYERLVNEEGRTDLSELLAGLQKTVKSLPE